MQILISTRLTIPTPWQTAFPDGQMVSAPRLVRADEVSVLWLDISGLKLAERQLWLQQSQALQCPLVVLSPAPCDEEGMRALQQGATGYAHVLTSAEQFQQIAEVLGRGGYWVGPQFMQRMMALVARTENVSPDDDHPFNQLTEREQAVTRAVARGASNREIALSLLISERTVKAHLSSIFSKLGVRDRVQLVLLVQNAGLQLA